MLDAATTTPSTASLSKLHFSDVQWAEHRLPKRLREMLHKYKGEMILAGGYLRSCVEGSEISDIDIFAPNKAAATAWADEIKGWHESYRVYTTKNAHTIARGDSPAIQIIHRWVFDSPQACVQSFDFTISCAALFVDKESGKWDSWCANTFYADLAAKRLVYRSPIREEEVGGSLLRVLKFYQRGFRIPLDSLGSVIARLAFKVKPPASESEDKMAKIITGLLYEVDPNTRMHRNAYLPSSQVILEESTEDTQ